MFQSLSLLPLLGIFVVAAAAIWVAGVQLSTTTDILSQRLGLGQALGLATAVSIWVAAAMGTAAALAVWPLIIGGAALALFVLLIGAPIERYIRDHARSSGSEQDRRALRDRP